VVMISMKRRCNLGKKGPKIIGKNKHNNYKQNAKEEEKND